MRCRECGAASRVLATRDEDDRFRTRRERLCDNNHRFRTYEVYSGVAARAGVAKAKAEAESVKRLAERYKRDLAIWTANEVKGESYRKIGARLGMSRATVQNIVERMRKERGRYVQPG